MVYIQMPSRWVELSRKNIDPEEIVSKVCNHYKVLKVNLIKKDRHTEYNTPRQIAMYFLKKHTGLYLKEIGVIFGNRDHTTVIHAIKTVRNLYQVEDAFKENVNNIEQKILFFN